MRDFNKVILMGNLAQDPEFKEIGNNRKVTNFVIAINREWPGPEGEKGSEVSFIDCAIFGGRAKTVADHFSKGRPIFIEGRLKQEKWVDKGTKKNQSKIRVIVENFSFIDGNKKSAGAEEGSSISQEIADAIPASAGNDPDEEFDVL